MDKPKQGSILGLFPSLGTKSRDIGGARSITLLIHGIGHATHKKLLVAAEKGYVTSGLGGWADDLTLSECPSIIGKKGAEALVFLGSAGPHFLIALPWSKRIRLAQIAKWSSVVLLVLAAVMTVTFALRDQIQSFNTWINPWSHKVVAFIVLSALGGIAHALNPSTSKGEFPTPMGYLVLPPILLLGLEYFVEGTWLWIPLALMIVVLWLLSTTVVVRCLRIAPTIGWRLALGILVVALTLPEVALLRIARQVAVRSAIRSNEALRAAEAKRNAAIDEYFSPLHSLPALPQLPPQPDEQSAQKLDDSPVSSGAATHRRSAPKTQGLHTQDHHETTEELLRFARDHPSISDVDKEALDTVPGHGHWSPSLPPTNSDPTFQIPGVGSFTWSKTKSGHKLIRTDPVKESELVTWPEFASRLVVVVVCLVLCWLAMALGWILDFVIDVLHFGGNEEHRTLLVGGTVDTIQWFHDQAPNARIIVVGHSLGSVIAAHAVASLECESWSRQIVLVTLGSPLNYLNRAFPMAVKNVRELSRSLCAHVRWINLWRRYDLIGKTLDFQTDAALQYCVGEGGHVDYWSDGAVWRAVVRETLDLGDTTDMQTPSAREFCLFERRLGTLVFAAITLLALCGAGLWSIRL